MMDRLFAIFGDFKDPRMGGADSFCDRLSSRFTVILCVLFSILVTTTHYVGTPVSCWCPSFFTSSHIDYTNKVGASSSGSQITCTRRTLQGFFTAPFLLPLFISFAIQILLTRWRYIIHM